MRLGFALLVAMAIAAPAQALPHFELVWSATTGSGALGGTDLSVQPGDEVTLDVIFDLDDGATGGSISLAFTESALSNPSWLQCPTGCAGQFIPTGGNLVGNEVQALAALSFSRVSDLSFVLASVTFIASGAPGNIEAFYLSGVDGISGQAETLMPEVFGLTVGGGVAESPLMNPGGTRPPPPMPPMPMPGPPGGGGGGGGGPLAPPIPEPTTGVLVFFGLVASGAGRRSRV